MQIGKNQQARFLKIILVFKLLLTPFFSWFLSGSLYPSHQLRIAHF